MNTPPARLPPRPPAPMDVPPSPAPIPAPPISKPSPFANRTLLLGGAAVLVVLVIAVVLILSQPNQPKIVGEIGSFNLTLIYGGEDSLTVKLVGDSHLAGLTLETSDRKDLLTDHISPLIGVDYLIKGGLCLQYIRKGTDPATPLGCNETISVPLTDSDIFWYSGGIYQPISLTRAGTTIGERCEPADGFGRCDFTGS